MGKGRRNRSEPERPTNKHTLQLKNLVVLQTSKNPSSLELVTARQALAGVHRKYLRIRKTGWSLGNNRFKFGESINREEGIMGIYNKYSMRHLKEITRVTQNFGFELFRRKGDPDIS